MSEPGFDKVWQHTLHGIEEAPTPPAPSPELKPLMAGLYKAACRRPIIEPELDHAIEAVLEYLSSSEGCTHDNCWVASKFIMPGDDHWEEDWGELSGKYEETLGIMGHELWQAVENPEWCKEYGGLPDQLLEKFKQEMKAS